jgi:hypothetical protein
MNGLSFATIKDMVKSAIKKQMEVCSGAAPLHLCLAAFSILLLPCRSAETPVSGKTRTLVRSGDISSRNSVPTKDQRRVILANSRCSLSNGSRVDECREGRLRYGDTSHFTNALSLLRLSRTQLRHHMAAR